MERYPSHVIVAPRGHQYGYLVFDIIMGCASSHMFVRFEVLPGELKRFLTTHGSKLKGKGTMDLVDQNETLYLVARDYAVYQFDVDETQVLIRELVKIWKSAV